MGQVCRELGFSFETSDYRFVNDEANWFDEKDQRKFHIIIFPGGHSREWFKETINPGQSITKSLEFSLPKAGTFYIEGRNFGGWDYGQVLASYPDGSGYGLYIDTPFIVINAH